MMWSVMCDQAVIWLEGVSSCHSLSHVESIAAAHPKAGAGQSDAANTTMKKEP